MELVLRYEFSGVVGKSAEILGTTVTLCCLWLGGTNIFEDINIDKTPLITATIMIVS
jgi:hypothetical protein